MYQATRWPCTSKRTTSPIATVPTPSWFKIERGVDPRDDLKRAVFPADADVVVDVLHAQRDEGVRRAGDVLDRELDELVGRLEVRRLQYGIGGVDDPEAVALDLKFGSDARQARPAGARSQGWSLHD